MAEPALDNVPSTSVFPRDPTKNDITVFTTAASENVSGERHHVINHHNKSFETDDGIVDHVNSTQNHRKTQHFIRGQIPGGSHDNSMIYGTTTFLGGARKRVKETRKSDGFLYGTSAIKRYEKKNPATRPNNKLKLEEMTDKQRSKHHKLAADQENYLSRYYEKKAQEQEKLAREKKKDLEMLKSYNPWGKPGGGAPRGYRNNEVEANITKHVRGLQQENPRPKGVGGGGSPNRTTSGTVITSLKLNPELRFQAVPFNAVTDPRLRYKPDQSYGEELDTLVQESLNRKTLEKRRSVEEEKQQNELNPFGYQDAIRAKKKLDGKQKSYFSDESIYDPWGKGYGGIPERKENGKILRNRQGLNNETKAEHWDGYGISAYNFQDFTKKTQKGNPKKKETLSKNTYGQAFVRDFSPKESPYNPWGRPGAGAPLKDGQGNIMTYTTGRLTNDNTEGSAQLQRDPARRKEYLNTLEKQRDELQVLRKEEQDNHNKPEKVNVVSWLRHGKVGQPNYDSETNEIRVNPKGTSDVTREQFQIRRLKNDYSKCYYKDLQEMAEERNKRRQRERTLEQKLSFDHVNTMNSFWGRPGGGAPIMKDESFLRKHSEKLLPTNTSIFR